MSLQMCSEVNVFCSWKIDKSMETKHDNEHDNETNDVTKDDSNDSDKNGCRQTDRLQMEEHSKLKQQNSSEKKKRKRRKKKKCNNVIPVVIDSDKLVHNNQVKMSKEINTMSIDKIVTEVGNSDQLKSLNHMENCELTPDKIIVHKEKLKTDFNKNCESQVKAHEIKHVNDSEECPNGYENKINYKANEMDKKNSDKTDEKANINEGSNFRLQCQIDLISEVQEIYDGFCNIDETDKWHSIEDIGYKQEKHDSDKIFKVTNQDLLPDSLLKSKIKDEQKEHNMHCFNTCSTREHDHNFEVNGILKRNNLSNVSIHNGHMCTDIHNKNATEISTEVNNDVELLGNNGDVGTGNKKINNEIPEKVDIVNIWVDKSNVGSKIDDDSQAAIDEKDNVEDYFNNINNDKPVNNDKTFSVQSLKDVNHTKTMTCNNIASKDELLNVEDEIQNEMDNLNDGINSKDNHSLDNKRSNVSSPDSLNFGVGSHIDFQVTTEYFVEGDISKMVNESAFKKKFSEIINIKLNDNLCLNKEVSQQQPKPSPKYLQGMPRTTHTLPGLAPDNKQGSLENSMSDIQVVKHLQEQQAAMTRLQAYIQAQKIESNLVQTSLRTTLRKKDNEIKMIRAEHEQQMTSFLSGLLFLEGNLYREHKQMSDILQDKDDIIRRQKAAIADLTEKNDRLLKALKESHGYSEGNGLDKPENIVIHQNGFIPIQDHGNKVILRAPKSKNADKTPSKVRFSAMKERLRRHKSSLELYHSDRLETLDETGLRYGSQENLVSQNGHSINFDRKERCRSLVDYPYGLRDVCEHHNESLDSCFGDLSHTDSISLSTSSLTNIGAKSCITTVKPLVSYGFNELSKSRSVPHALPTVAENDSGNISLKERPLSLPSVELLAKDIQAARTSCSTASLSGYKSSLPPPSPTNSSSASESNPFKSIKNVFKRRGSKKKKSGITGNQESNSETLKQHFKKFNLS